MGTCPTYSMQEQVYKEYNLLIFGTAQVSMRKKKKGREEKRREKRKEEKKKGRRERGKKNRRTLR